MVLIFRPLTDFVQNCRSYPTWIEEEGVWGFCDLISRKLMHNKIWMVLYDIWRLIRNMKHRWMAWCIVKVWNDCVSFLFCFFLFVFFFCFLFVCLFVFFCCCFFFFSLNPCFVTVCLESDVTNSKKEWKPVRCGGYWHKVCYYDEPTTVSIKDTSSKCNG